MLRALRTTWPHSTLAGGKKERVMGTLGLEECPSLGARRSPAGEARAWGARQPKQKVGSFFSVVGAVAQRRSTAQH